MCIRDRDNSILAIIATKIAWIFAPLGFGNWKATVASVSGLIAKENVVGTFGVLYHFGGELSENGDEIWAAVAQDYTALSAYAFMILSLIHICPAGHTVLLADGIQPVSHSIHSGLVFIAVIVILCGICYL